MKNSILRHPLRTTGITAAFLLVVFALLTRSVFATLSFAALSSVFIFSGFIDMSSGVIPNAYMSLATFVALALQIEVNGVVGGIVRFAVVAVIWTFFALVLVRRKVGGGDLKMIGVTWLALAAFPVVYALTLFVVWPLALGTIVGFLRLRRIQHLRAGLAIASSAIITWTVGLMLLK